MQTWRENEIEGKIPIEFIKGEMTKLVISLFVNLFIMFQKS